MCARLIQKKKKGRLGERKELSSGDISTSNEVELPRLDHFLENLLTFRELYLHFLRNIRLSFWSERNHRMMNPSKR